MVRPAIRQIVPRHGGDDNVLEPHALRRLGHARLVDEPDADIARLEPSRSHDVAPFVRDRQVERRALERDEGAGPQEVPVIEPERGPPPRIAARQENQL